MNDWDEMKLRYEFIHFDQVPTKGITSRWLVRNNRSNDDLGVVAWYGAWRQYCFEPSDPSVYSAGCLNDISHFIGQLQDMRLKARWDAGMKAGAR